MKSHTIPHKPPEKGNREKICWLESPVITDFLMYTTSQSYNRQETEQKDHPILYYC